MKNCAGVNRKLVSLTGEPLPISMYLQNPVIDMFIGMQ